MLNPKVIGAIAGFIAGIVIVCFGFAKLLLVALFVLIGWFIGKVWLGEIDLIDVYQRFISSRARNRRR